MNKNKTEIYNEKLEAICRPEIDRLKRREEISQNILDCLNRVTEIDYCGLNECHLINLIGKEIDRFIK